MDEFTLLRRARPDVAEPTNEAFAHARARLMTHVGQVPQDRADRLRHAGGKNRRRPFRLTALAGIAASLAAVAVYAPWGGQPMPASAAGLLTQAAEQVSAAPEPAPGEYLKITTRSEALNYSTNDEDQVTGAYVSRTVDENYVPADRDDEWVGVSYSLPAQTFYGGPSLRSAARRDFAQSAQIDDPAVTRAMGGQLGNGELGGSRIGYATITELPSLSRDPAELLEDLSARSDGADSIQSVTVMTQISTLLSSGLVDPELTAAMFQSLALLPDVEITQREAVLDGQGGTAIGVTDDQGFSIMEVVIDLDEGRFLGIRSRQIGSLGPIPAGTTMWSTSTTTTVTNTTP